jgi:type 1 fimbria pilin
MRAIQRAVGCLLALLLLTACAAAAQSTKQIQIGTFVFHGTTDPNCGQFCNAGYEVSIDASELTGDVLSFGDITVAIGTISQSSGPETTPIDLVFVGGPSPFVLPDCAKVPCRSIDLQLTSTTGKPFSLTLLDGSTFTTYAVNTITIKALPGQHVVKRGQSVPIMLLRDASGK